MGSKGGRRRKPRARTIECLEARQVMSADPVGQLLGGSISHHTLVDQVNEPYDTVAEVPSLVPHSSRDADFWLDPTAERDLEAMLGDVEQTLSSAHNASGLAQVRNNYGFIGAGQTVAVIDSGIAWDHYALGGGLGANYRVVGGWDFTEEFDANPYDDGPEGSHGTHVAGIVGADRTGTSNDGVAPGVDLVGLRVFNDQGNGYFAWVEDALQWVHQNRNAYENPITAVNLSIGTTWNSNSVPLWSMLEDEFAQLKGAGIFVTVSAGNDFANYNATGLSYPAASPYVVPVMAADDGGNLSHFSQRHSRAIAAPGRFIVSTIPDYTGNHNSVADDFASYSGTSMAAPYVAAASVLLREAMQFVGYTNITQDTIFNHMMATADSFFDAATNQTYKRLNLASAFSALMPIDEYGSTSNTAHGLGSLSSSQTIAGLIGTLDDQDFFTFTASSTGTAHLSVSSSHGLEPVFTLTSGSAAQDGYTWSFEVVAGQSYTFSLATTAGQGIGYYDAELTLEQSVDELVLPMKTIVRSDGAIFSLDSQNWLSVNGSRVWNCTYDFTLGGDGTLYWQSTYGLLQHRRATGEWVNLDYDSVKFFVNSANTVYSLGNDGWLTVNGSNVWQQTRDFSIGPDQTLYWQSTTGLLQHRLANGVWQNIDNSINRFAVRENGMVYSLAADGWLKVNGSPNWQTTQDFIFTADQSLYWLSTYGLLQRLPNEGSWETLGQGVTKFAVRQDGAVYSLMDDRRVLVDGVETWINIIDIRAGSSGGLAIKRVDGTQFADPGHFHVSSESMVESNAFGVRDVQTAGGIASNGSVGIVSASLWDARYDSAAGTRFAPARTQRLATPVHVGTNHELIREIDRIDISPAWDRFSSDDNARMDESSESLRAAIDEVAIEASPEEVRNALDALFTRIGR